MTSALRRRRQDNVTEGKVLVLGDDTRSFLAIVRSLGRKGIEVHCAPANFRSPALKSRYIKAIHSIPPWMPDHDDWLNAMVGLLRTERFDLVIPCNETSLLPIQYARASLSHLTKLAIPHDAAIAILFDKFETRELAKRLGIPVAKGRLLERNDSADRIIQEFGPSVFVKPRQSYALGALATRGAAHLTKSRAELEEILGRSIPGDTLLEEFFPGYGVGVSILAHDGRVCQAFEHHRAREVGGASFYRVSAPLDPEHQRACQLMLAELNYTGLAMFEFRQSRDGAWILLEVNARPWGSMPLPLALGVDFPYQLYTLLTSGREPEGVSYPVGVYGRNLIPDLRAIAALASRRAADGGSRIGALPRGAAEFSRIISGREVHDVFVGDDPRPALQEAAELAGDVLQRSALRAPGARSLQRWRAERALIRALRHRAAAPTVLFVCRGNICRSPFAASLLVARAPAHTVVVQSAGIMPQGGRVTPALGQSAATTFGVDLAEHRSVWMTTSLARSASVIFVFDRLIRESLYDRYPDVKTPVIMLGDLVGVGDIRDPVDGDFDAFMAVYRQIETAIAAVVRKLEHV